MSQRIVLSTIGSLGDLHPYLAIALGLKARGYQPVIATSYAFQPKIEAEGIEFYPVRPHLKLETDAERALMKQAMDIKTGTEFVIREVLLPCLRDSYADLLEIVHSADLFLSHPLIFAAPLVAAKTGTPWFSSALAPISVMSAYDPPTLPIAPMLSRLRFLGPRVNRALLNLGLKSMLPWGEPIRQFQAELGLPPTKDPLFADVYLAEQVLVMFSQVLAKPQPDWKPQIKVTGFPFYDRTGYTNAKPIPLSTKLTEFLAAGSAPIVFTLGSSAVLNAGNFYLESAKAAEQLGYRAILLVGENTHNLPADWQSSHVAVVDYAPFSELFSQAAAIVHQGGIGTTGQALRAGKPMLVVPYSHDQPDNAARVTRLGVARTLPRSQYNAQKAASELNQLLRNPRYAARATEIGVQVQAEDGVQQACEAIAGRIS